MIPVTHPTVLRSLDGTLQNAQRQLWDAEKNVELAQAALTKAVASRDNMIKAVTALRCAIAREKAILAQKEQNQ